MNICKDCRHWHYGSESGPYCNSPQRPMDEHAPVLQQVYGGPLKLRWIYATEARTDEALCGPGGKWFEGRVTFFRRLVDAFSARASNE